MKFGFTWLLLTLLTTSSISQIESDLDDIFDDHNLMGMSVLSICEGEVVHTYHRGYKDFGRDLLIDDSTMYRIASISKTITATGMMMLYDQGAFSLSEDISQALGYEVRNPNFPDTPITYEMVLSHTSSLQDGDGYSGFLSASYNFVDGPPSVAELLLVDGDYYTPNMWRQEEPGSYFAYSNINFGLIATLIEALSGQRFDVFMKEHLFEPMAIAGSFNVADIENIDNVAVLYRNQGGWNPQADHFEGIAPNQYDLDEYVPGTNGVIYAPQGGLRVSPSDLAKLLNLHYNLGNFEGSQLITSQVIELMHEPVWTYDGSNGDNYYGLFRQWGLGIQSTTNTTMGDIVFDGLTMYGHPGEAYGLISDMYFEKETGSGIIFMTNGAWNGFEFGNTSAFYTLEEEIFEAVYEFLETCQVSVAKHEFEEIRVFPTPAQNQLNIVGLDENVQIVNIHDMSGKILESKPVNSRGQIGLQNLDSGVYTLSIPTQDVSLKFVICK